MKYYTHLAFSLLIGLLVVHLFDFNIFLFLILLAFFSIFLDIDTYESKMGSKLGIFSKILKLIFGHRKFFHSLLFIILGYALSSFLSDILAIAFLIGASSHLLLDALTPEGIMPFYPFKMRINAKIKTGSVLEKILFVLFVIGIILSIFSSIF